MKNYWKYLCCLLLLIVVPGCLGHSVKTSGDEYLREYGDLEFDNERGIQNITFIVYGSSENETSSRQDVGAKQSSAADGKLGLNGGAVSEGAGAVATGLQTLDYLLKADTPDAVLPPIVVPDDPDQKPVVKPDPPVGSSVEVLKYHGRTNGDGDGSGDDPRDRPTWYGNKRLEDYPVTMRVVIKGCVDRVITIENNRYYVDGLLVKQSDVPSRGLSVLYDNSCMGKTAAIEY